MNSKLTEIGIMCVTALCEMFNRRMTDTTLMAYGIGLEGMTDEQIQHAASRAMRECKFMPTPAELREFAGQLTGTDRATLAWEIALKATSLGPYQHVDFEDKTINATIRNLGGWVTFTGRLTDAESEKWLRQEFIKAYHVYAKSGVPHESSLPLPGLNEVAVKEGRLIAPEAVRIACDSKLALGVKKPISARLGAS